MNPEGFDQSESLKPIPITKEAFKRDTKARVSLRSLEEGHAYVYRSVTEVPTKNRHALDMWGRIRVKIPTGTTARIGFDAEVNGVTISKHLDVTRGGKTTEYGKSNEGYFLSAEVNDAELDQILAAE